MLAPSFTRHHLADWSRWLNLDLMAKLVLQVDRDRLDTTGAAAAIATITTITTIITCIASSHR